MASVQAVAQRVLEDKAHEFWAAKTPEEQKKVLAQASQTIGEKYNPQTDPLAYRAVIFFLGAVVIIVAITYAWYTLTPDVLAVDGTPVRKLRDLPDALIALGSAAIGALAGLLAPSPRS